MKAAGGDASINGEHQTLRSAGTITLLIRHAESEANAGAATDSPASIRLTARGHQQAADLAARFDHAPDLIVVSSNR